MASKNIKGITIEFGGDTTKLDKALAGVEKTSRSAKSELKEVEKAIAKNPDNIDLWKQKQEVLNKALEASKNKLKTLVDAQGQMNEKLKSGEISGEQYRAFQRELENTRAEVEELTKAAEDCSPALETLANKGEKLKSAGDAISGAGESLLGVTAGITAVATASVAAATDFEDAMAKVSTIADSTQVPIEDLENQILELSDETGISASNIADNVYNAISAGQKTADAVNFVSKATSLAKAGFTDSASALDVLTTILNAYGLEADQVGKVSDNLIMTQNLGKTTVGELASVMGKVIPTAKSLNVDIDDLCASYAIMTSNGIATAETTTYLNSMLNELGKDGSKAAAAFKSGTEHIKEGGLTMAEAMEQGWELTDVLSILDEEAQASGTSIQNLFGSAEAGKAANVLWDNASKVNDAVEKMAESAGSTEEAFNKLNTTSDQAKIALNQVKNAGIELGQEILVDISPIISQITEKIKELTDWFKNLSSEQKQQIIKIGAIAAAIGPVLIVIGKLISAVGKVLTVLPKVKSGINAIKLALSANPIGLIVAAIGVLIAAFTHLWKTNEEFRNSTIECWERIKKIFTDFADAFTEKINSLGFEFSDFSEMMSAAWDAFCNVLVPLFESTFTQIENVLETVTTVILGVLDIFIGVFTGDWDKAWDGVKSIFEAMWTGLFKFLQNILDTINKYFSKQFEAIKTTISIALNTISGVFKTIWSGIVTTIKNAVNDIINHVNNIKTGLNMIIDFVKLTFTNAWSNAWDNVKNIFRNVFNGLADIAKAPFNSIIGMINGVLNGINGMVDGLNSIHFDIPNWVPSIGGKSFGMNLSHVGTIPYLAKGGTVSEGNQAIVGEAGAELLTVMNGRAIVQPLTNNSTTNNSSTNSYTTIINVDKIANDMDIRTLGEKLAYEQSRYNKAVGMA